MNFIRSKSLSFKAQFGYLLGMEVGNILKVSAQYLQNYASYAKKHRNMDYEYHYDKYFMVITVLKHEKV